MALDGFRPDRYDVTGARVCLAGVAVIMFAAPGAEGAARPRDDPRTAATSVPRALTLV